MAAKKKQKQSRSKKTKPRSREQLVAAAAEHLDSGRFKDAAADYKQLLKDAQRPEWIRGLAEAYAGRAEHLASRGMIKEAIALWQNRAEACGEPVADPRYLQWLVAADRSRDIARLYRQDAAGLAGADGLGKLRARLAAAALADGGELIGQLSADDPIAQDFAHAEGALAAFSSGDDEALDTALARIAFRSPYRDFRQLLKALACHGKDPAAAARLCARVPADTPFAGMLTAIETADRIDAAAPTDAAAFAALADGARDLVAALAGWSTTQQQLIEPLAQLGKAPTQKTLFDFVITYRNALGKEYARGAAFILAGHDGQYHRRLRKIYGELPEPELARLFALTLETTGMPDEAVEQWRRLLGALASEPAQDADSKLRRALIDRHVAELIQPRSGSVRLDPEAMAHLESSLDLDPDDHDSTRQLLDHYLAVNDLKVARGWAKRAVARFPDDPACLLKAAEIATAGKAYKKAARFAERILVIDPINAGARGLLVDAHLSHAHKQIKAKKADAARREIEQAGEYARSATDTGRVALSHALTLFSADGAKAAAEPLAAGVARAGGGLVGIFFLLLEAGRAGQDLNAVAKAAGTPAIKTLGERAQVLALVDALGALRAGQEHTPSVEAALSKLAPAFNQVAKEKLERGRAEQVCETLLRYRQYAPLKRFAQTALKGQHRYANPLFVFYRILGTVGGDRMLPWDREADQLEAALADAQFNGDTRTAERIRTTLDDAFPRLRPSAEFFDPFEDDLPPEPEPSPDSIPTLVDGEFNPGLREAFSYFLGPADMRRLEDAVESKQTVPQDIAAKIQAIVDTAPDTVPPPTRGTGKKNRHSRPDNDFQDDFFGDGQ